MWSYILCYFPFTFSDYLIFIMFYIKLSYNIDFHTNIESGILWYFWAQLFCNSQTNPQPSIFYRQQQVQNQITVTQMKQQLKYGARLGVRWSFWGIDSLVEIHVFHFALNYKIILFSSCLTINRHIILIFSQILNIIFLWYFQTFPFFVLVKKIHNIRFWSTTTSAETKLLLPNNGDHWNMDHYWVSADRVEVDLESDLIHLASDNLWQYTTLPSQCERLTWTRTWHLLYFDHWYHF